MIRHSLSSKASVKRRETISSGLMRKRISSWTKPSPVTPPPTILLAKSTCRRHTHTPYLTAVIKIKYCYSPRCSGQSSQFLAMIHLQSAILKIDQIPYGSLVIFPISSALCRLLHIQAGCRTSSEIQFDKVCT